MVISNVFLSDRKRQKVNQINIRAVRSAAAEALLDRDTAPLRWGKLRKLARFRRSVRAYCRCGWPLVFFLALGNICRWRIFKGNYMGLIINSEELVELHLQLCAKVSWNLNTDYYGPVPTIYSGITIGQILFPFKCVHLKYIPEW